MPRTTYTCGLAVLLLFVFSSTELFAGATNDPLAHLRAGHPRLLLTDEGLTTAKAAAKSDPLRAAVHKRIIDTAETLLNAPPIRQPNNKTGPEQDRYAVHYILTCAMAYRLTGDERFAARAKSDLLTIAAFPDWNPGHFLSVGEMSFAMAIGYDWLYSDLSASERATIKQALVEKSLSFADAAYHPIGKRGHDVSWAGGNNNWNEVCNSGLVSAALAIADEEPDLAREVINGARVSLTNGLSEYAPDGGYPEGPGYWTYGTTYTVIAFAELESALGTDFGLASAPGFDHTLNYYEAVQGPFGPVFNYADATDDLQDSPARAWLAERFHQPTALRDTRALLVDSLSREPITKFNRSIQGTVVNRFFALHAIWFPKETTETGTNLPLDLHFRGIADIAVFRSAWNDPRAIFVGFKAGEDDEHHNHLDLGSFVLDADEQRWAMDPGPDSYDLPGYFDTKPGHRWSYFRLNNHGHNTVAPGDALQKWPSTAPIVAFGSSPNEGFAVTDLTGSYPDEVISLRRGIALLDRARVLVQDEFRPSHANTSLHWGMLTEASVDVAQNERSAILTKNGRSLKIEVLAPRKARLHVGPAKPPTAAENQNEGISLVAIDFTHASTESTARLAVLLTPVGDKWPHLSLPTIKPLAEWR